MQGISVYIPVFNGERYLQKCLDGILSQTRLPDEIIVINDGSTDGTLQIAKSYGDKIRVISQPENRGLACGRNLAVELARFDLVASLDVDCVPTPRWLEILEILMRAAPSVSGAGGDLLETHSETLGDRYRCTHLRQSWGSERVINPKMLYGANTIFRRAAILNAGGYNPACRTNGEDVDFCRRLKEIGGVLVYEPKVVVQHYRQDTVPSVMRMQWQHLRHPYIVYKPHKTLTDVWALSRMMVAHIWKNRIKRDFGARRWWLVAIGIVLAASVPIREWVWYRSNRSIGPSPVESNPRSLAA